MKELKLGENITRLRHERKITQEELADFIGVTKASVSKWENRQSTPDILLLPQLAAFFGVTVDELMGYEAQLSKEQIMRWYTELCGDFAKLPFEEVLGKVRSLTHRYYSCYPFLLQVVVLYLNHYMFAGEAGEQETILKEADGLCDRILHGCSDVGVSGDAVALKAMINLQMGNAPEVIEALEPVSNPSRISEQNSTLLIQAYQMAGKIEKAKNWTQIQMYRRLLDLVSASMQYLVLYINEPEKCEETIRRVEGIMELYRIKELHPNLAAQFCYQASMVYAANGNEERAMEGLGGFEKCVCNLLNGDCILHGDEYFNRLEEWIDCLPLGENPPRDLDFAKKSALEALKHPCFDILKDREDFKRIYRHISEGGKHHG